MMRTLKSALSVVLAMIIMVALVGCGSKNEPKRNLMVAIDYSGSVSLDERKDYTRKFLALIDRQYGEAYTRVYIFAKSPQQIFEGQPEEIRDAVPVSEDVASQVTAQGRGTNLGSTLNEFARRAEAGSLPSYGVILSDGDCFDSEVTREAAEKLAKSDRFKCLMVGPIQIDRLHLENGPFKALADSGKLVLFGTNDVAGAFERFGQKEKAK